MIDKDEVLKIAKLAHLKVDADELTAITESFNKVVDHVATLKSADLSALEGHLEYWLPPDMQSAAATPKRGDAVEPSFSADDALANAPERFADFFLVPKVVNRPGEGS